MIESTSHQTLCTPPACPMMEGQRCCTRAPGDLLAQTALLVAEPDAYMRRHLIDLGAEFGLRGASFRTVQELESAYGGYGPTCVILDTSLPQVEIRRFYDTLSNGEVVVGLVVLSARDESGPALEAMRHGASDFIVRPASSERLRSGLDRAIDAAARRWCLHEHVRRCKQQLAALSDREHEVAKLIAGGCLNKEIAYRLGISYKTVEGHRERIRKKLRTESVAELVRLLDFLAMHT